MNTEKVFFENKEGSKLSALLDKPFSSQLKGVVLFAHCFTCNKNFSAPRNISKALVKNGFAVLRFDFTGLGNSEGDFSETNFSSQVSDIKYASDFLSKNYHSPSIFLGHSLGGTAVLMAAEKHKGIDALVTIGSPFEPNHVTKLFSDSIKKIHSKGKAEVQIGGRSFYLKKQFLDDLEKSGGNIIKNLRKPLLIFHSPQDQIVSIDNAAKIYDAAMHPKSFISLDKADHLLSDSADSLYVGETIASWSNRYISSLKSDENSTSEVVVETESGYTSEANVRNHFLISDEPTDLGGNDLGMTPMELVAAGLGACTNITLKMYANRKKMTLERVQTQVAESKKTDSKRLFKRVISVQGNLDQAQKSRLLEIANKCPVHKLISQGGTVETSLSSNDIK